VRPRFQYSFGCTLALSRRFHIVVQDCDSRCRAASIAAIFGYHGHSIDQDSIFQTVFGTTICRPAGSSAVLDQVLR
jgi:hypothetical protein